MPCNACQDPTLCTDRCQAYAEELRSCTCHPDDNPPKPCPRKFAFSDCVAAHVEAGEMPRHVTAEEDRFLHAAVRRAGTLIAGGKLAAPKGEAGEMEAGKEKEQ